MATLKEKHIPLQKTALAAGMALALGSGAALADIYTFSYSASGDGALPGVAGSGDGLFTMLDPTGAALGNTSYPYYGDTTWGYGLRTQISGSLTFDTADNSGSVTVSPFEFFNNKAGAPATATGITFTSAGNDPNNGDPLVLGNMLFDWNGNNGIPVALVWDIKGLVDAIAGGLTVGDAVTGGATIASNAIAKNQVPVEPAPVASTTWDATDTCSVSVAQTPPPTGCMTVNPIGSTPLIANTIGGDPMVDGPFTGFNANFDFIKLTLTDFVDTTPPTITLGGSNPTNLVIGDTYVETATCSDAVDGDLTSSMSITGGPVTTGSSGSFVLTYNCSDNSANAATERTRTVNVTAAGTPSISLIGDNPATHEAGTTYTDAGATCTDPADGAISLPTNNPPQFFDVTVNTVDSNVPGSYAVTYGCTNSAGTSAPDATRTVDVVDTTAPVIALVPTCPITHIADGTDPTPTATASDLVDGSVAVAQNGTVNPNPNFAGALSEVFNLGFSATDAAGNTSVSPCDITIGNPDPVATLVGNATVVIGANEGFTDPGATCADFVDGALPDATPDTTIDASAPNGSYTITYTCGPNSATRIGTTTRSVVKGVAFAAASDSGSAFSMLDPVGKNVGGADDIFFSWTGSLYSVNDPANQSPNMFMGSAQPQPFFGFPWQAHDIRAFGPGDYTIATSRGNTLNLHVAENQIGAHMLFDWNGNNNIDVVLAWAINSVFVGSPGNNSDDQGSKGQSFGLASIDADNDGLPGVPMADGPFEGFNANFNIKLSPLFALPDASASAAQAGNDPASTIAASADPVTVTASVNPDVSGVYTYGGPFSYDWSTSDAVLLAANTNGTSSTTFVFDPSGLADGAVTAVVKVTDGATGLTSTVAVPMRAVTGVTPTDPSVMDSDGDGIPDSEDGVSTPTLLQVESGNNTSFLMESSDGQLILGDLAAAIAAQTGVYQASVDASDIPGTDTRVSGSCIGGCFSFKVTGLTPGAAVDVVLPLSEAIPTNAGLRKFINNVWRDFDTSGGNAVMSAGGTLGSCPSPSGSWTDGLTEGDVCVKLTIVDGGQNDTDGVANGEVSDPTGVSGASTASVVVPPNVRSASTGGCTLGDANAPAHRHAEWWLIGGLLGWLGFGARRGRKASR